MAKAPQNQPDQGNFSKPEQPTTYPDFLDRFRCNCPAGAQIRPSPLPSATIDLGDLIADHARILSNFTSAYSLVTVPLKMIGCIIDVLCCIANPFCLIAAMIRLFGVCIPDFILLFPQFALPAIIICIAKIILAIVEYILDVLLPIIEDIVQNIQDLIDAFSEENQDAKEAVSFKIAALIQELYNIAGIIAVLGALYVMVGALIRAGMDIPCGGSGGSCQECGDDDDICPSTLQETSVTGTDGQFVILYGDDGFSYNMLFYSQQRLHNFLQIRGFFPRGFNYTSANEDDIPYKLNVTRTDGSIASYIITGVDTSGYVSLYQIPPEYNNDGYLTNTTPAGIPLIDPLKARFTTKTETFNFSLAGKDRYLTMYDTRGPSQSSINGGSWKIQSIYDAYNVLLERDDDTWSFAGPTEHIRWILRPSAPSALSHLNFEIEINHEELIRAGLIGVGCHPAVRATKEALNNRFPDLATTSLPDFPDVTQFQNDIYSCLGNVAPPNVDSQYILDNYQNIATNIVNLESCVSNVLNGFKTETINYVKQIYPTLFNPETSADGYSITDGYYFDVNPKILVVGENATIQLIPLDRSGKKLGLTLPDGIIDVVFNTNFGKLSFVTTELDANSDPTGKYTATITSLTPGIANISAQVGGRDVAFFNGNNLIKKEVQVEFVSTEEARTRANVSGGEASGEPLGRSRS